MKKLLLAFIILSSTIRVHSQTDYSPIRCQGIIPSEFIDLTSDKIEQANENYQKQQSQISKKQFKRFNSKSNFYVDYLLKSGAIVFGTSMNDYVNRVGAYVLKSFPSIANDIRFYIVKSPSVNAFTSDQGIVFINIGLIAQLENEAQLAFIISHELIHYKYKHSFESYKKKLKAKSDWAKNRYINNESKNDILLKYSRKNEMIADSLGFMEGYYPTKYSYDEALNVFDVLLYSNLPFNEIEFDTTFFNDENYSLSSINILKEVNLVSNPEDYDDHKLTHPNIKNRRNMMIDIITSMDNPNDKKYIISEKDFKKLQTEARFEMSNLYLANLQYYKAFYNSYLLLRKYPESDYLRKTIAYCIYAIAIQKNLGNTSTAFQSYKKVEGQSQRISYLFEMISNKELTALAVKLLWNYHEDHPEDAFIINVLNASIDLLIDKNSISYNSIYPPKIYSKNTTSIDSSTTIKPKFKKLSKLEYEALTKYDKIRYDKKYIQYYGKTTSKSNTIQTKNYLYVLSSEYANPNFKKLYKSREIEVGKEVNSQVDIQNILIVNPQYYQIKDDFIMVQGTEEHELEFTQSIIQMGAKRNIKINSLDILNIQAHDVAGFNDLALLNAWLIEYELLTESDQMKYAVPWLSNYTDIIRQKYNLRYIATSGLLEIKITQNGGHFIFNFIKGILLWQASPYFFTQAVSNDYSIYHFFYCIDMETNQTIITDYNQIDAKVSNDFLNALNYNVMYQLKSTK